MSDEKISTSGSGKEGSEGAQEPREAASAHLQPELSIGLVGHVDHGKTTLTEALTGKWTDTHSEEIKRGITIKLGYADTVFRKCPACPEPQCYTTKEFCPNCGASTVILRKVSFVDAPGHESLMATMLSGANIMDGALLLVAANEPCPQPQTQEHIMALQIIGILQVVIAQNKIDLVSNEAAVKNYQEIVEFLKTTPYAHAPIIPISAHAKVNLDVLIQAIQETIPTPKRDLTKEAVMLVARSFDINKPGVSPDEMVGGVLGGALKQGSLKAGEEIEVRPGLRIEKHGKASWQPITTKIVDIKAGGESLPEAFPGGSLGLMTTLDPAVVKSDSLAGSLVGRKGMLPKVWNSLFLKVHLLERVVGAKDKLVVEPIKVGELLMLNVNSGATVGGVDKIEKGGIRCSLKIPVCAGEGSRVTISRRIGARWRLIGYGILQAS